MTCRVLIRNSSRVAPGTLIPFPFYVSLSQPLFTVLSAWNSLSDRRRIQLTFESQQWKKTSLGHLVRPMCMRPLHPLPPLFSSIGPDRTQKKKRRVQAPLVRARRQRIDPTKYGPVHISAVLLDTPTIIVPSFSWPSKTVQMPPPMSGLGQTQKADEKPNEITENDLEVELVASPKVAKSKEIKKLFAAERAYNLALLSELFGDKAVWEGREDSDGVEGEANESGEYDEGDNIALGPTRQGLETMPAEPPMPVNITEATPPPWPPLISPGDQPGESALIPEQQTEVKRLKDLFTPAVEPGTDTYWIFTNTDMPSAPFSLLAGLELDLDDEFDFGPPQGAYPPHLPAIHPGSQEISSQPARGSREQKRFALLDGLDFSARIPYFFPLDSSDKPRGVAGATKDIFAIADSRGWNDFWKRPPTSCVRLPSCLLLCPASPPCSSHLFPRDEVKVAWVNSKVELTRDWKQRYRDAQKKRRRGCAGAGGGSGLP